MSFFVNPAFYLFSVGPGIGVKSGGKSVCLNLMDADESNQQFAYVSTKVISSFFDFCTVLGPVAGILGVRGYGAGKPGKTGCK